MKRNLVLFGFLLVFGLLGATGTALAQSTVLGVSSSIDQARFEGIKEATGQVVLTSSSNGVIGGSGGLGAGTPSIITITYGANLAVAVGSGNVSCNTNGGGACASGTDFTVTGAKGQPVVKISFVNDTAMKVGGTITISGVRVNANAFGSSGLINATAAAVVPASISSTNAITFSTDTTKPVANVNPKALDVSLSVGPASFLSCVAFTATVPPPDFELTVKEKFAQALTSVADENGLSGAGTATQGSNILVTFTGVPNGVMITNSAITPDPLNPLLLIALDASTAATQTAAVANDTLTFLFDVNTSDTTAIEKVLLDFTLAAGILPTGLTPNAITANVALTSEPTAAAPVPDFIDAGTDFTAVGISDCVTNLLFPWTANVAGYDTGLAIANTTRDPFGVANGGAVAQAGSCTLTGYPAATGTPSVSFTSASVPAGAALTMVLSSTDNPAFNGFVGYIIAVCQFQNAHGFAYITDNFGVGAPNTAQGYVALVIPNPSSAPRNPAGAGKGEALAE